MNSTTGKGISYAKNNILSTVTAIWDLNQFSDNVMMQSDTSCMTYGEFSEKSSDILVHIPKRSLVFNLCSNEIGAFIGYTSFLNGDIVQVMLPDTLDKTSLNTLIEIYRPTHLWMPDSLSKSYHYTTIYKCYGYRLIKTDMVPYPLSDDLSILLTTSGSTGSPKLVRQTYQNIRSNAESIAEYLEITDAERPITTLPMNYTYGLSVINSHLLKGATILLTNKSLMQKEFWDFFKEQQATSIAGVPYTYEMLKRLRFFRMELPSLKTLTQAGGKLSPELHREFAEYAKEKGKRFVVMYGQTEATARMSYLPWQKTLEKCGSMGIAIPGGRFDLIDEDGNTITSPEVIGELVYTGPNVTPGYAECGDDLIKGDERHGVLVTGDLAKRDADGYYYIVGRKKRFLKIFGNRVNLDETERLIKAAFPDTECACIGKDDKMTICITSQEKHTEIRNYLSQKTGLNHVAFQVKTVQQIPKNDAGKTLYAKLEEEL